MERRTSLTRGEVALDRLLQHIDAAIDAYRLERREQQYAPISDDALPDSLDEYWEAWQALPFTIRDWLLWYVPGSWALAPGVFRRLLLRTAGLIVWNGVAPRIALRRAATRLRLPPPRPARNRVPARRRQFRAAHAPRVRRTRSVQQVLAARNSYTPRSSIRPARNSYTRPRRVRRSMGRMRLR